MCFMEHILNVRHVSFECRVAYLDRSWETLSIDDGSSVREHIKLCRSRSSYCCCRCSQLYMVLMQVCDILLVADVDERAIHDSYVGLRSPIRYVLSPFVVRCEVHQLLIFREGDGRLRLVDYHPLAKVTVLESGVSDGYPRSSIFSEVCDESV